MIRVTAAQLCNGIYDYPGFAPVQWDRLSLTEHGPSYGLKEIDGTTFLIFRGSTTPWDWVHDFEAVADPFDHSALGPVHPGFLKGLEPLWEELKDLLRGDVVVAGHSLGAGQACIFTGIMTAAGRPPLRRVCFGEPRPGFPKLAELLSRVPAISYRNGDGVAYDLITDVPVAIGPEDYVHPCPLTDVCEEPAGTGFERWGPFAWHAMPLYLAAVERMEGLQPSGPVGAALKPAADKGWLPIH